MQRSPRAAAGGLLVIGATERVSDAAALGLAPGTAIHLPEVVMDTSEYMPMFLAETREHLAGAQPDVVELEEDPADRPTVEEIFRIAHSLKGMSATMGFADIAELTHADGGRLRAAASAHAAGSARRRSTPCSRASTRCRPRSSRSRPTAQEALDPAPLIERLRTWCAPRTAEQAIGARRRRDEPAVPPRGRPRGRRRVLHVARDAGRGGDDAGGPRATWCSPALADHGEVIGSIPATEDRAVPGQRDRGMAGHRARGGGDRRDRRQRLRGRRRSTVATSASTEAEAAPTAPASAPAASPPPDEREPRPSPRPAPHRGRREGRPSRSKLGHRHRPRRRRAPRRADALDGRARDPPHRGRGADRAASRSPGLQHAVQNLTRSSQALQSMVMQVRMIPVDVGLPALPAARARPVDQARQGRRARARRLARPSSTAPSSTRSATRSCTWSATRSTTASSRRRSASPRQAATGTLDDRGPPRRRERRDRGPRRRSRDRPRKRSRARRCRAGPDRRRGGRAIDMRGASSCCSRRLLDGGDDERHLRPRRRDGRGAHQDPRARRRGPDANRRSAPGLRPDPAAADARDRLGAAGRSRRGAVRDPARPDRAHGAARRADASAGRRPADARPRDGVLPLLDGARVFGRRPTGDARVRRDRPRRDRGSALAVDDLVGQRELVTRPLPRSSPTGSRSPEAPFSPTARSP